MAPGHGASPLPQLQGRPMVTDGGLETDLIFHHGVDLPHFAAFPLLDSNHGRALLAGYYDGYAAIARRAGAGLVLESPTWRASPDWGARLGYSLAELVRANNGAIALAGGLPLAQAISEVDGHGGPDYFMVNCAHPTHIAPALAEPGPWRQRIVGLRYNASAKSHAELDQATGLDDGNPRLLADQHGQLAPLLPPVPVLGGCCGTDTRHVAALWRRPPASPTCARVQAAGENGVVC